MKITDDAGKDLPWDGKTFGRLKVAGPAVSKAYFRVDADILDEDGYFDTGDVATIDEHGYMRITDRSKDVIKSGGEWISSIDLENLAVGHPAVAEAAVIGVYHPKWDERPLLIVQLKQGQSATREDILKFMDGKIAKWWMPDDVVFVDGIPHTATGKILKTALRDQFKAYSFPERGGVGSRAFRLEPRMRGEGRPRETHRPHRPCATARDPPDPPLNLPRVRGLKRASLQPGAICPARFQPGRF